MLAATLLTLFVAVTVAEHGLQPELGPRDHRISEYAKGATGWLMTAGFAAWSLSLLSAAVAVSRSALRPRPLVISLMALLLCAAVGAALTCMFETGTSAGVVPTGYVLTSRNRLHDVGSGGLALALWGAVALSACIADSRLRGGAIGLLLLGATLAASLSTVGVDAPGVRQRALLGVACAWQYLLLAVARTPSASAGE